MRILIFGGEYAIRELLRELLLVHGECTVLAGGEEALRCFALALEQRCPFHLVVCDLFSRGSASSEKMLPILWQMRSLEQKSGLCTCNRAGMLLVGAFMKAGSAESMEGLAPATFLRKPFEERELRQAVQRLGFVLS